MKVLHVASEYPPAQVFGLGRFVHGLARAQARAGHEVHVLTNSSGGKQDDCLIEGVHLHRIPFPNPPQPPDSQGEVFQFNHGALSRYFGRDVLHEVEVVVAHDWLTVPSTREIARHGDVPLVFTVHDEIVGKRFGALDSSSQLVFDLERLGCRDASRVIANSSFIGAQLRRHYGADSSRLAVARGGADPAFRASFTPAQRTAFRAALAKPHEHLVAYVGRLDAEKGLETLAQACLALGRERHDMRFVFVGRGAWQGWLEETLEPLGSSVQFTGYLPQGVVAGLYQAADVVVVPSLYEPLGLVAREAQLAGAAVLVADSGGLREVVEHDLDGLRFPAGDANALHTALQRVCDEPELAGRLGAAAQTRAAEDGSWDDLAQQALAIYVDALDGARSISDTPLPGSWGLDVSLVQLGGDPCDLARVRDASGAVEALWVGPPRALPASVVHVAVEPDTSLAARLRAGVAATLGLQVCVIGQGLENPAPGWLESLLRLHTTLEAGALGTRRQLPDGTKLDSDQTAAPPPEAGVPQRVDRVSLDTLLASREVLCDALAEIEAETPHDLEVRLAEQLGDGGGSLWRAAQTVTVPEPICPVPAVVIVAYDGRELTEQAVRCVYEHTLPPYRLVLVDNGSKDSTAELFAALIAEPPPGVEVLGVRSPENLGFPGGANLGIETAGPRDVVVLNNDTEVRQGWLRALLACRRVAERPGVVTAKILNFDGTVQSAGGVVHDPEGGFRVPHAHVDRLAPAVTSDRELPNAGGPCMLLTQELIADVGVFDEAFSPGYFEDSDLCLRARAAGFSLHYAAQAEVFHHAKATSSLVAERGELDVWGQFERNRELFLERWASQLQRDQEARAAQLAEVPRLRIVLCYGKSATTTAAYCERALRAEHDVVTAGPGQELDLGPEASAAEVVVAAGGADLLLAIEGENYTPADLAACPCATAWWAIDSHLHVAHEPRWHLELASGFDHVFVAQPDFLPAFAARGIEAHWLPLGCDPAAHSGHDVERDLDVVFVGHVRSFHRRRRRLLDRLAARFELTEAQGVWGDDMTRLLSRAKVVFNCSLAGDVNMRVYEAMAAGGLLVTDATTNNQEQLFADGEHLLLYDDRDLEPRVAWALAHDAQREAIAARGRDLVLSHHTYADRMRELVNQVTACTSARLHEVRSLV